MICVSNFFTFFRYVDSDPEWAKKGHRRLGPGSYPIIYKVRSAQNDTSESCKFTVNVVGQLCRINRCKFVESLLELA